MQLEHLLQFINKYMPIFEVVNFYNSTRGEKKGGKKKLIHCNLCSLVCVGGVCSFVVWGFFKKKI